MKRWLAAVAACLALAGCTKNTPAQVEFSMGEKAKVGSLTYSVNDATWKGELGEGYQIRTPNQRFLLLNISITNGGGSEVSIPLLQLEGASGQMYQEIADGNGVDQYIGILRNIAPAQTLQGRILFDVPLTSYRLRIVDGGEPAYEKFAFVDVPLNLNADAPLVNLPTVK